MSGESSEGWGDSEIAEGNDEGGRDHCYGVKAVFFWGEESGNEDGGDGQDDRG